MMTRRQRLIAGGLAILLFVVIGGLIYGLTGAFTSNQYNERLVLSDNSSQYLVDSNWTDVYFGRTVLGDGAHWLHPSIVPVESAHVISQQSGRFDFYFGIHIVPDILSVSCSEGGAPCVVDGDCCQSLVVTQFCYSGSCVSCGDESGASCSPGGDMPGYVPCCRPGLTCTGTHGTCEAPTTEAPTGVPTTEAPTEAPTTGAPTDVPTTTTIAPGASPTTGVPTAAPSTAPTETPSASPTEAPTTPAPTDEPTPAPTSELAEAGVDIASCLTYTRVVRQRNPDPAFYQVGDAYTPQLIGGNDILSTYVTHLQTQAGDVYKFQWITDCASMSLSPTPVDLGLLGVPNEGVLPISAYLVAVPSL